MRKQAIVGAVLAGLVALLSGSLAIAEEDHLKGYKIKDLNQVVPPANPYTLTNDFGSETCELKKPQFFLKQSEKNGGDDARGGPAGDFVCYKAKCTGTLPPITDAYSQFGLHSLETKKAKLVCLPVDPTPPCTGQLVGGFCWFLGADGASCDTTCTGMGQTCDVATVTYAGTGGTSAQCGAVLTAFGVSPYLGDVPLVPPTGCVRFAGLGQRFITTPTTCAGAVSGVERACACQ